MPESRLHISCPSLITVCPNILVHCFLWMLDIAEFLRQHHLHISTTESPICYRTLYQLPHLKPNASYRPYCSVSSSDVVLVRHTIASVILLSFLRPLTVHDCLEAAPFLRVHFYTASPSPSPGFFLGSHDLYLSLLLHVHESWSITGIF